jgi:hypothetical protein
MSSFLSWIHNTVAITLASAIASGGCIAASLDKKSNCEHSILNESAGVNFVAGLPVYVSPKKIIVSTGCQTMWDSKGRITIQIFFSKGKVVQYIEYAENGIAELICEYVEGAALPKTCPNLNTLANGFAILSDEIEKSLPTFDDLRRKTEVRK